MQKKRENIIKTIYKYVLENSIRIMFAILMLIYLAVIFDEIYNGKQTIIFMGFPIVLGVTYIIYKLFSKIESKNSKLYCCILFICTFVIYVVWGKYAQTQCVSDYEVLVNAAKDLLNGKFVARTFDPKDYFYIFNYQIGYVYYLAFIMKIFGQSFFALKLCEIVVISLTNVCVYIFVRKVHPNNKVAVLASIIYSLLMFNIIGSGIINNQHISMFFIMLALITMSIKNKYLSNVVPAIMMGIAIILRPNALIIVIAIICCKILQILKAEKKEKISLILMCLLFMLTYKGMLTTIDFSLRTMKVIPDSITQSHLKYNKYVIGMKWGGIRNHPTKTAEKNMFYYDLADYNFDYNKYNNECKKFIKKNLKENFIGAKYFIEDKMNVFIAGVDNQVYGNDKVSYTELYKFIQKFGYEQYLLMITLCAIYIFKRKKAANYTKDYDQLFMIAFIGYFAVHILIEVQTRYRYEQYLLLVLLSAPIMFDIFNNIELYINNKKMLAEKNK